MLTDTLKTTWLPIVFTLQPVAFSVIKILVNAWVNPFHIHPLFSNQLSPSPFWKVISKAIKKVPHKIVRYLFDFHGYLPATLITKWRQSLISDNGVR